MKNTKVWSVVFIIVFITIGGLYGCGSQNGNDQAHGNNKDTTEKQKKVHVKKMNYKGKVAPAFTAAELAKNPTTNWLTNGGDLGNNRYSPLNQINVNNISKLKGKWITSLGSGANMFKYSGEATPIVYDGVMFTITGADFVTALDAKTGKKIWEYQPHLSAKLNSVCCGWTSRGVALGDGKVFVGLLDARLIALDQKTGKLVWETKVADWKKGYSITSAPLYYNGKVYTGISGGEYGIRGRLTAYDADIGREIWRFYTVPSPGEKGSETWPSNNKRWLTGGAPIWSTPAVDPELGLIYFAAGNTGPDFDGSVRKGDNLFADSIIALNAETGKYKWHFQEVHHDLWDMDPANPVVLYDVKMNGEMKKGIAQAGKTGWVYLLDRTNGKPLVGIDEKKVPQMARQNTSPTQPVPRGDAFVPQKITKKDKEKDHIQGKTGNLFDPFWKQPVTMRPSSLGGANWGPSAYNPNTEYIYVLANDSYVKVKHDEADKDVNHFNNKGDEFRGSANTPISNTPSRGVVTALDVKTNKIAWQIHWPSRAYSGVLTTKGNLVFVGHNNGHLIAYNAKTGKKVWEFQTDAGVNAPPVTYEIDGKQYISVFAAGSALAGSQHGDKIYTFSLDGTINSLPKSKAPSILNTPDAQS